MYPNVQQGYGNQMQQNNLMGSGGAGNFNPMMGILQQAAAPGFIPLAQPPTMQYIPPPSKPLSFKIAPRNQAAYAKIYAVLQTVQIIQDEVLNGNIENSVAKKSTEKMKRMFDISVQTAGFSPEQVREFADACDLNCSLAIDALIPEDEIRRNQKQQSYKGATPLEMVQFGGLYTTLNDYIVLKNYSEIRTPYAQFRALFDKICPPEKESYKAISRKWSEFFRSHTLDDKTCVEFKNDIDQLNYVIE